MKNLVERTKNPEMTHRQIESRVTTQDTGYGRDTEYGIWFLKNPLGLKKPENLVK